jgi:dTDP-glucose pyrophosphorylase
MKEETKAKVKIRSIKSSSTILDALKQMDQIDHKLLIVFDDNHFLNVLSIGDIQRAILKNTALESPVKLILRKQTNLVSIEESFETIKAKMQAFRTEFMPILNMQKELVDVLFWEDLFPSTQVKKPSYLNLPVVIMAGGKGTRLKPITNIIPKPLIPIGEKTIIEEIMDRFVYVGCTQFHISVNYKAETIKHYFTQLNNPAYKINYFQEEKPLGTAGSLYLVKDKIKTTFFVTNCDIIINEDYSEILNYHRTNKNELTIVSALRHYPIPYGTIETGEDGLLYQLKEKPELTFQINSGMYILEPHLLKEIPEDNFFHITHLIEQIQKRNGKVGVFPVSEGSWKDIGDWNEYLKLI